MSLTFDVYFLYTAYTLSTSIRVVDVGDPRNARRVVGKSFLGEFEQMVLLAVLQLDDQGYALGIRRELEERAGRSVSRGALYRTLDRLEDKSLIAWSLEDETPERGGHPRRRFRVTDEGVEALRASREALFSLWEGLDARLGGER